MTLRQENIFIALFLVMLVLFSAVFALADYAATPPPLAHSLTPEQIDRIVADAPADTGVSVPAWYAKMLPSQEAVATNQLAVSASVALPGIVADTRSNIVEVASLTGIEIVGFYLGQLKKPRDTLVAAAVRYGLPTNTLEYLIGAGMRQDMEDAK